MFENGNILVGNICRTAHENVAQIASSTSYLCVDGMAHVYGMGLRLRRGEDGASLARRMSLHRHVLQTRLGKCYYV